MKLLKYLKENSIVVLAIIFFISLLLKSILFINYVDHFPINFIRAWKLWGMYIGVAGVITSFVFIFKGKGAKWFITIFSIILDVWFVANLIYWRSYHDFLNVWLLNAAGNLKGYWTSIFIFFEWKDLAFSLISLLLFITFFFLSDFKNRKIYLFLMILPVSILLTLPNLFTISKITLRSANPMHNDYVEHYFTDNFFYNKYFNPINYLGLQVKTFITTKSEIKPHITIDEISPFVNNDAMDSTTDSKYNLVLILFESLESWVIESSIDNQEITPNLNKLIKNRGFIADKITSQVRSGMSADGLLTINTGLLPIFKGITSSRYKDNHYFSIADALQTINKVTYIHHDGKTWNQNELIKNLHYDSLSLNNVSDYLMIKNVIQNPLERSYFMQIITIASHTPFTDFADSSKLVLNEKIPTDMTNYIKSVNYTDNALGILFESLEMDNTIIVVTGDHTIFHKEKRDRFKKYCDENHLNIPVEKEFVPLIISSPAIKNKIEYKDTTYQMDIFPTILHVINRDNYIWKGFGINLLNPEAKRKVSPEEANRLSDAIIRNNFLKDLKKDHQTY